EDDPDRGHRVDEDDPEEDGSFAGTPAEPAPRRRVRRGRRRRNGGTAPRLPRRRERRALSRAARNFGCSSDAGGLRGTKPPIDQICGELGRGFRTSREETTPDDAPRRPCAVPRRALQARASERWRAPTRGVTRREVLGNAEPSVATACSVRRDRV